MLACFLALVLLMDVSFSVEPDQYAIQRDGTAAAIESPEIGRLIERSGAMAVIAIEYSSFTSVIVPWTIIRNARDGASFAQRLRSTQRDAENMLSTATGDAIAFSLNILDQAPCESDEQVIDLSTDGENNLGRHPTIARDDAIARGVKINGLGVRSPRGSESPANWLRDNAITPGGFVIEAMDWAEFASAIRRKLSREITEAIPSRNLVDDITIIR